MLLVIDIGNTNIVIGVFDNDQLLANWRINTVKTRTTDEYGILFHQLLATNSDIGTDFLGVIISSVVPPVSLTIEDMLKKYFKLKAIFVGPGLKTGMPILYDNPHEVGADRIVNAVGAFNKFKCPLVIVDFGTATTFDVISAKGEYLGGAITPGVNISLDALFMRTAKLPRVEIKKPPRVIGRNTVQSIQSGILYGYVGLVDGIVERIIKEMDQTPKVISTGGLAPIITPESRTISQTSSSLTLDGLLLIWKLNEK